MFCQCGSHLLRIKNTETYYCPKCQALEPTKQDALCSQEIYVLITQPILARAQAIEERRQEW